MAVRCGCAADNFQESQPLAGVCASLHHKPVTPMPVYSDGIDQVVEFTLSLRSHCLFHVASTTVAWWVVLSM